jgi:hypothetical protein
MADLNEYSIESEKISLVEEVSAKYNAQKDFTSLEAWKKSRDVKLFFYKEIIPLIPVEEKHNLSFQIRKAAISITANISEGYGRYHYQEGISLIESAKIILNGYINFIKNQKNNN